MRRALLLVVTAMAPFGVKAHLIASVDATAAWQAHGASGVAAMSGPAGFASGGPGWPGFAGADRMQGPFAYLTWNGIPQGLFGVDATNAWSWLAPAGASGQWASSPPVTDGLLSEVDGPVVAVPESGPVWLLVVGLIAFGLAVSRRLAE